MKTPVCSEGEANGPPQFPAFRQPDDGAHDNLAEQQVAQDGPRIINPLVKARKKSLLVGLDLVFGIFPSPKERHF